MTMTRLFVATVTLVVFLEIGCRSVPRDECVRALPKPSARPSNARFITNVEPRSFLGVAVDSLSKNRLQGVNFRFEDLERNAYTDSLGIARFRDLPPGWHRVMIRTLGYEARRDSIQVSADSGAVGVYVLARRKFESCQVVITS
jgi:hypothetical protein